MFEDQHPSLQGRNTLSGGYNIDVWRVEHQGLGGFLAAFGAVGHSLDNPGGIGGRLGGDSEPSYGHHGCVLGGQETVFATSWGYLGDT